MSTARVTSIILEVLAADASDGASDIASGGEGGGVVSVEMHAATSIVGSGSGGGVVSAASTSLDTSIDGGGSGGGVVRVIGALAGAPVVTYAEIVDGRVTYVGTGPLPSSTDSIIYFDLTGYTSPSIGDYFSEICQEFTSSPPTVPPGEIVPPWTKPRDGTNGKDGTNGLDGGVGPFPPASVVPTLIAFHADGKDNVTITNIPVALTEVASRMRTRYDLSNVCAVRVQCQVMTAGSAGSELVLMYSTDSGATWDYVADPFEYDIGGPWVAIDATGDACGDFRNVCAGAQGDVLLSLFTRTGNGSADPVLGNMGAYIEGKTVATDQCAILTGSVTCPVLSTITPAPGGAIYSDDFTTYASDAELYAVYANGGEGLYSCTDDAGTTTGGAIMFKTASGGFVSKILPSPTGHFQSGFGGGVNTYFDVTVRVVVEVQPTFSNLSSISGAYAQVRSWDNSLFQCGLTTSGSDVYWSVNGLIGSPIDQAAFASTGVHEMVMQFVASQAFTPGTWAGEVDVTMWVNGSLIGTRNYVGDYPIGTHFYDRGFSQVLGVLRNYRASMATVGSLIRAIDMYEDGNPF